METQLTEASSDNSKDHATTARLQDLYENEVQQPSCNDYHLAWICPVADIEVLPARLMLDEEHPALPCNTHYELGDMDEGKGKGLDLILEEFPPSFESVKPLCRAIRKLLFPYRHGIFTGTPQDPEMMYDPIIQAFNDTIAGIGLREAKT